MSPYLQSICAMSIQIHALDPTLFMGLFGLSDAGLRERRVVRMAATDTPGFPRRVGLRDRPAGASVLLLNWQQKDAQSPYRASGPIFVEDGLDGTVNPAAAAIPDVLRRRLLSLKAHDATRMRIDAEVAEG
jgi:hypothetical protein